MAKDYSRYVEFQKAKHQKDLDFFFGEGNVRKSSNKYSCFNGFIDDDNIVIVTNNIKMLKGNYVFIVDNNKGIYLKDWQVKRLYHKQMQEGVYLVKLNRNFFRAYEFSFNFDDFSFEKEETFDNLVAVAKEQAWVNDIAL